MPSSNATAAIERAAMLARRTYGPRRDERRLPPLMSGSTLGRSSSRMVTTRADGEPGIAHRRLRTTLVLASRAVVDASAGVAVSFVEVGPAELKGVAGSIHLHVARRAYGPRLSGPKRIQDRSGFDR
jgi:hypothetical protein